MVGLLPPKMPPMAEVAPSKPEAILLVMEAPSDVTTLISEETRLETEEEIEDSLAEVGFTELEEVVEDEREKGSEVADEEDEEDEEVERENGSLEV